jgi:CHAT domain-containing protein/lipopolysaccharide biosynthesis regulator YciM
VELRLLTDTDYGEQFDILVDELIDEYIEDELPVEDRERAEQYFFASEARREKLKFALALKKRKAELISERRWGRRLLTLYLPVAASVLAVLGLGLVLWRTQFSQPDTSKGLVALHDAFRERRPIEARISGFNYAPVLEQRGGGDRVDYVQRDRAASILLQAVSDPSADTHHALGKYYLAERQFDKAIDQFEAALKFEPQNARIHSDLGAALLERGRARSSEPRQDKAVKEIEEFGRSLDHLKKALELDGSLLEPLFNRALLYQHSELLEQAESDWRAYLERDPNSKWADEARQHLAELERRRSKASRDGEQPLRDFLSAYERGDEEHAWDAVRRNYTSDGNTITNALLDSYLASEAKGDSGSASDKLQALRYVGQLELRRAGDTYTSELARFYGRSTPRQRLALARAREQMREGYRLFLGSEVKAALGHYEQAKRTFDENENECETAFAEYRMGHSYLFLPELKKSGKIFERLRPACERRNYKWLLGQSLYRMASLHFTLNEYSESIDYARRALEHAEQTQDSTGTLNTLILLADQYRALNNESESLSFLRRALAVARAEGSDPPQTWGIFTAIGLNLNALGLHPAALEYQKEALRLAQEMKPERPLLISRSYDYLGRTYAALKDYDSARAYIDMAFAAGRKVTDERSGREMMANTSLHAGDVYRQAGDHSRAVEFYERSIRLYEEINYPYFTYPARKGKLLSYVARGDDSATEAELRSVLEIFEQYRLKLNRESQRNTFFDVEQSVYDLAIDFAHSRRHDPQQAFEYSELSRARSLLDAMRRSGQAAETENDHELHLPSTSAPLSLADIQRRMPEQAQLIQYAVLEDKLLIWLVTRTSVWTREMNLGSRALSDKVHGYLRAVDGPSNGRDAEAEKLAMELYDVLVAPIEPLLDKTKLLCIVPDKLLNYLPFTALVATDTGRYLIEDFRLLLSQSSTIFVDCSEQAARKAGLAQERLLSVGDPSFDDEAFPLLRRLLSASREAEAVTASYTLQRLLLHGDATERAVKSEMVKSNVAHFALHYVVDEHSSSFSKMVLAAPAGAEVRHKDDDGVWQIHEIYKMRLPRTRLVVLSACQTGVEQQYRGEGAMSVARPFMVAGVPLVVASLWPVDSQSTEQLMVSFHQHRTRNRIPTAEALRRAQLEMLRGEDTRYRHPYYWAAFNAIGGYTEY